MVVGKRKMMLFLNNGVIIRQILMFVCTKIKILTMYVQLSTIIFVRR